MPRPDDLQAAADAIQQVIARWLEASAAGDTATVLGLMTDDVVFLTPGAAPFGKAEFAAASRAMAGRVRFEARSEVEEIAVSGTMAVARSRLAVTVTPTTASGASPRSLAGSTLSVFRKESDGRWLLARDANLLVPLPPPARDTMAAVPVLQVASVRRSIAWYRDALGFGTDSVTVVGDDPVFAILQRDGVELMLQNAHDAPAGPVRTVRNGLAMDVYLRVRNVEAARTQALAHATAVSEIVARPYGCREFDVVDPDGHILVVGECG
jgi:uncharacterized protein (TIGR02246 family)